VAFLPVQWQSVVDKGKAMRASLSNGQLMSLIAVFVGVVALLIGSTWYLNRTEYRVLFSDLDGQEAATVVERLTADNVDYQLQDGGRTILVPAGSTDTLRLQFAGDGMPSSGRMGFEIFDKVAFGQTEFLEHVNYRRALEGELARTIATLSEVQAARVHIAMQKESLFGAREQPAKASVVLTLAGTRALAPHAAASITNLVAASVEGLRPEQVVILDSTGRSLARGAIGADDGAMAGADVERQQKYERDMAMKVVALLEPVVGIERVRANVSVHLHGSSQEQTREEFDPSTVLRSEQTTIEGSTAEANGGIAGAQSNLPAPVKPDGTSAGPGPAPASVSSRGLTKSSKLSNYEVTKTVTHSIRPRGEVARVSVAVLVDDEHVSSSAQDGTVTTKRKPRDAAAMQKLQKLVAASLGIDSQRGDQVTVENITFDTPVSEPIVRPSVWQRVGEQSGGAVRGVAVLLMVAMVLLMVVRPVLGRLLTVPTAREHASIGMPQQLPRTIEEIEGEIEAQLDAMPHDGDRRQPVLTRRAVTLANQEPESAAKLVRGWLAEGGRS
jgi:flagellar M-ring protein FliF